MSKSKYVVVTKFAHFKVGQTIELDKECPAAAIAHVRPFVEGENDSSEAKESEQLESLKRVFQLATGKAPGKTGVKKIEQAITEAFESLNSEIEALKAEIVAKDEVKTEDSTE